MRLLIAVFFLIELSVNGIPLRSQGNHDPRPPRNQSESGSDGNRSRDFESISPLPSYVSPSQLRASGTLRSVAISPDGSTVLAVGDVGTVLRSEDGGENWRPIDAIRVVTESANPSRSTLRNMLGSQTASRQSSGRMFAMPTCTWFDVAFLSPRHAIIVGGGYEPVTGISRGVCLLSDDGGQTWQPTAADELPLLRRVRLGDGRDVDTGDGAAAIGRGVIEARGDASEASGVDRFYSYDGGQTWVEDTVARPSEPSHTILPAPHSRPNVEPLLTDSGPVWVNDTADFELSRPDSAGRLGFKIAVGQHGQIWRETHSAPVWSCVRGKDHTTAVLFVARSPQQTPWTLVGSEAMQENRRVAIVFDEGRSYASKQNVTEQRSLFERAAAAAAAFGVAETTPLGHTPAMQAQEERLRLLRSHRPAVVAVDDSLDESVCQAWMTAIETVRRDPAPQSISSTSSSASTLAFSRIVLTRSVYRPTPQRPPDSDPRLWRHASILRGNALLTSAGCLAGDVVSDALMMIQPGRPLPVATEVTTFRDVSGTVRRDLSLAGGLPLTPGHSRGGNETFAASHRRLQLSAARISQTTRFRQYLLSELSPISASSEIDRLKESLESLIRMTTTDDRTRLIWDLYTAVSRGEIGTSESRSSLQLLLLNAIRRHASVPSIVRFAELHLVAIESSIERQWYFTRGGETDRWQSPVNWNSPVQSMPTPDSTKLVAGQFGVAGDQLRDITDDVTEVTANDTTNGMTSKGPQNDSGVWTAGYTTAAGNRGLSPFQIAPASFENAYPVATPPTRILVPETKQTVWQSSRGWTTARDPGSQRNRSRSDAGQSSAGHTTDSRSTESSLPSAAQRINWDFHRIVLAARSINGQSSQLASDAYGPPTTRLRPILDGSINDECWRNGETWVAPNLAVTSVRDDQYDYFAVRIHRNAAADWSIHTHPETRLRLSVDCDGDYLTAIHFDWSPEGEKHVSVDGLLSITPLTYAFINTPDDLLNRMKNDSSNRTAATPVASWLPLAEIAIPRTELPSVANRVRVSLVGNNHAPQFDPMPSVLNWQQTRN